jgi:hypothetical protein
MSSASAVASQELLPAIRRLESASILDCSQNSQRKNEKEKPNKQTFVIGGKRQIRILIVIVNNGVPIEALNRK